MELGFTSDKTLQCVTKCIVIACGINAALIVNTGCGNSNERADADATAANLALDIPECSQYVKQLAQQIEASPDEQTRAAQEQMLQAQRETLRRLAAQPATRVNLRDHCRALSAPKAR